MIFKYQPKSKLEKFGEKVFNLLVDNFSQTFYVGGMVRDLLLGLTVTDIDISTEGLPEDVINLLLKNKILLDLKYKQFGVIIAKQGKHVIEIATFRKEAYKDTRYPKITFIKSAKLDSKRRDFTINALYLSPKFNEILDFHKGLKDLKSNSLKFIGNPTVRISEDPLRIIRALRFAETLNLKIETKTKKALINNMYLIKFLTESRIKNEINKIKNIKIKNNVIQTINNKKSLDIK